MRKIIYTLFCCASLSAVTAQTLVNGSFENWVEEELFDAPTDWGNSNIESPMSEVNVTKDSDAAVGDWSVYMETVDTNGELDFGYVMAGTFGENGPESGVAFQGMVDGVRGQFKYDIMPGDSAIVVLAFFSQGVEIGMDVHKVTGTQNGWTEMNFISPYGSMMVDEVLVAISSSNAMDDEGVIGSWMMVDDLAFTNAGSIVGTIPNGGFENWQAVVSEEVSDWNSNMGILSDATMRTEDAYAGDYAIRLQNGYDEDNGTAETVLFTNGDFTQTGIEGGQAFTDRPVSFSGARLYSPNGMDIAYISVQFWAGDDMVGAAFVSIEGTDTDYQTFEAPVQYMNAMTPDHVIVTITPGQEAWSALLIDDFAFSTATAINDLNSVDIDLTISPNPVNDRLTIKVNESDQAIEQIRILDPRGAVVMSQRLGQAIHNGIWTTDMSHLNAGIYFVEILTERGRTTRNLVKN